MPRFYFQSLNSHAILPPVKLTAQVKLQPTPEQADALKRTLKVANVACNYISGVAWQSKTFGQYKLHHLVYADVRAKFGLSAQMTVRSIAKVADAYKLDKAECVKGSA